MDHSLIDGDNKVLLDVRALTRCHGDKIALRVDCLTVARGEMVAVLGSTGSGKTTFLKLVLGLLRPTAGTVRVFGLDPTTEPKHVLSRIGYVSEDPDLPKNWSIADLLNYNAALFPRWSGTRADALLNRYRLALRAKVADLSKGEHLRVRLLLALAPRPDLLLLDNPGVGLDPEIRQEMLRLGITTRYDDNGAVLFTSCSPEEVAAFVPHKIIELGPHGSLTYPFIDRGSQETTTA